MSAGKLESALGAIQDGADATLKSAAAVTRELRKAKGAAAGGQVRELRRALAAAASLADELSAAVAQVRASCDIDEEAYLASGEYAKELLAVAAERGVAMFEEDERLLCYPSLVRVVLGNRDRPAAGTAAASVSRHRAAGRRAAAAAAVPP